MREHFKIITNNIVRNERLEQRILEYNQNAVFYSLLLAGLVLLLIAIVW